MAYGLATACIDKKLAILSRVNLYMLAVQPLKLSLQAGLSHLPSSVMVISGLPDKGLAVSSVHYTWHCQERVFPAKTAEGACAPPMVD